MQIVSQRSETGVLAVFRRLQEEQPSLFGQATLKRITIVGGAKPTADMIANARLVLSHRKKMLRRRAEFSKRRLIFETPAFQV